MAGFKAQGMRIVDSYGRERIFNGINVCDKGHYDNETKKRTYSLEWTKGLAHKFKEHGFNLIRLGFTWDAVEPEPGKINEKYISFLKSVLDECEQEGIYVYLDMHQDLYSAAGIPVGDGAPGWATKPGKYEFQKTKLVWAEGYFWGRAVHQAFDSFWDNVKADGKGLQDWYAELWEYLANELGSHPSVIGFDVMNEPFPGKSGGKVFRKIIKNLVVTTISDRSISKKKLISLALDKENRPRVLDLYTGAHLRKITSAADSIIRQFDTERYFPFISKTGAAMRKVIRDGFIFMENCYYSNLGIPFSSPAPVIDGKTDENVIFAPHAYDLMVDTPAYKFASNDRVKSIFDEHKRAQQRLNVPVVVGEWGGFSEGNEWFPHIRFLLDLFDSNKWSNTYWAYFDGLLETELYNDVLTRPYPRAVTGEIDSYKYDYHNDTFTLKYNQSAECSAPTEIFAHKKIKSVTTDGEYTIKPVHGDSCVVEVKTAPGAHTVIIEF